MKLNEIMSQLSVIGANLMHYKGTKAEREAAAMAYTLVGRAWNVLNAGINCANDPEGLPPDTAALYGLTNDSTTR